MKLIFGRILVDLLLVVTVKPIIMASELLEDELPVGYRFVPTDVELVTCYLRNKVFVKPIPPHIIQDISSTTFYSKPPNRLVENPHGDEKKWYFFIDKDAYFGGRIIQNIMVGEGIGFWRSIGVEEPIYNNNNHNTSEGEIVGLKICFTYYISSGSPYRSLPIKTHWRLEEYRLPSVTPTTHDHDHDQQIEEWILGRITRGKDYTKHFSSF